MSDVRYWLWLSMVLGAGRKVHDIISEYKTPRYIYENIGKEFKRPGVFSGEQLKKLENTDISEADRIICECEKRGWKIITPDDEAYPKVLLDITNYPLVLFAWGDEKLLNDSMLIGLIGTRHPSQYGKDVAYTFAKELVKGKAVIVGGGAQGIDSVGHNTAMENGGKTILIMGCGFGYKYLIENEEMRKRVTCNGVLISEYPPFTPPTRNSFLLRNRIIAALCRGVLVIEAGQRSGTLSTARKVREYNRDLFVVTGDAKGTNFLGANELAKTGANIVFSAADILSLYGYEIKNRESFSFGTLGGGVFAGIDSFPDGEGIDDKPRNRKNSVKEKTGNYVSRDMKDGRKKDNYADSLKVSVAVPSDDGDTIREEKNRKKAEKRELDTDMFSPYALTVYEQIACGRDEVEEIAKGSHTQIRNVITALTELEMAGVIESTASGRYILK